MVRRNGSFACCQVVMRRRDRQPVMKRDQFHTIGILFWIAAVVGVTLVAPMAGTTDHSGRALYQYFTGPESTFTATDRSGRLRVRDPVFMQRDDGGWDQIGSVTSVSREPEPAVVIALYRDQFGDHSCRLIQYRSDTSLTATIATLLPAEKRLRIQQRLAEVLSEHGDELTDAFVPLVERALTRSLPLIEQELWRSIARHQDETDALADRWNQRIIKERLVPLARREILPIVREYGEPTATTIGRELWDSASLWRFGWRVVYDRSPLPTRNLAQQEWERFVDQEAIPIFEQHTEAIVESLQQIVREIANSEAIRSELAGAGAELAADAKTRKLVQTILTESLIENEQLRQVWREIWRSDEARQAFSLAADRLEPVVRQIGDDLFGTQERGIDPDFARVLRNQVLLKDRRWIVARRNPNSAGGQPLAVEIASGSMPYPIVHLADRE